ncbi:MAG: NAD(P)/FAD-dependent oxidoreductase [Synergistaceae bacterium]|nr:NAD(P)/FAD-dependent oxidoreductase [Synergistaceae bacterium]
MKKKIFTPSRIGRVQVKNRIVLPSMCTYFCESDGSIGDDILEYVRERARGGVGLIVMPGSPHGKPSAGRPAISDDRFEAGWRKMAEVVHEYDGRLFCQLHPAALQAGRGGELTLPEDYDENLIGELIGSYAAGARRCMDWGVDGVEIHGGHAHEIAQFMSPLYNMRKDSYGGDDVGRSRLSVEIVRAIKVKCAEDFPVIFRISSDEMVDGGRKLDGTIRVVQLLEQAGADAIHVSIGMASSFQYISAPMDLPDCFNVEASVSIKNALKIPVIAVNRIVSVPEAEKIVEDGLADFVAMGRANLSDPELLNKYTGENPLPTCECIGCNQGCKGHVSQKRIRCVQNPRLGRELTLRFPQAPEGLKEKKILIVGAGPAGLEVACRLAQSGIKPLIYEKSGFVGGLIRFAQMPPHKENIRRVVSYREKMLEHFNVPIHLNKCVDADLIRSERPDYIILATGSVPAVPLIKGIDGECVFTGDDIFVKGADLVGHSVAILGGGLVGCETAEYLATRGKEVSLFELCDEIASELVKSRRYFLLNSIKELGIKVHTQCKIEEIRPPELLVAHQGTVKVIGDFNNIVVAAGRKSTDDLSLQFAEACPEATLVKIGDASSPGLILDVILNAAECASKLLCA